MIKKLEAGLQNLCNWALSAWPGHTEVKASTGGRFDRIANREEKKVEDDAEPAETQNPQGEQQAGEDDAATEDPQAECDFLQA